MMVFCTKLNVSCPHHSVFRHGSLNLWSIFFLFFFFFLFSSPSASESWYIDTNKEKSKQKTYLTEAEKKNSILFLLAMPYLWFCNFFYRFDFLFILLLLWAEIESDVASFGGSKEGRVCDRVYDIFWFWT